MKKKTETTIIGIGSILDLSGNYFDDWEEDYYSKVKFKRGLGKYFAAAGTRMNRAVKQIGLEPDVIQRKKELSETT